MPDLPYHCLNLGKRARHFRLSEGEHTDLGYSRSVQENYRGDLDRSVRERFKLERQGLLTCEGEEVDL